MYGSKIKLMKKKTMCNGVPLMQKEVNLRITNGEYFVFVAQKEDILSNGEICIVDTHIGELPSGIVVI